MKKFRLFAWLTLAAGMAAAGTTTLSAQDWHDAANRDHQDLKTVEYNSHYRAYDRISALRNEIARDQARLSEDRRHGNRFAATRDSQELARDQRELNGLLRDSRHWR